MELYIHIPFCVRKCRYCSFVSFPASEEEKNAYISLLLREAELRCGEISSPIETVYIGGGTPSLLSPGQLKQLVSGLRRLFPFSEAAEFSLEANPGTITESFLDTAILSGINRLSVGMQAFQPRLLTFLGRFHSFDDVKHSVSVARSAGINNLNLDLIFGIPSQTMSEWNESLEAALQLAPEHLSAYGLIPEEGTPLFRSLENKEISLPDPDLEREMYDLLISKLHDAGLEQYEISNFARPGFECRHNIGYWTQVPYLGLGISAASMRILQHNKEGMTCLRTCNLSDYEGYRDMITSGMFSPAVSETVSPSESRFETLMLSLRMNQGISGERYRLLHGVSIESCYGKKLAYMCEKGFMRCDSGVWSLTRKGMDIQNSILVEFMEDPV